MGGLLEMARVARERKLAQEAARTAAMPWRPNRIVTPAAVPTATLPGAVVARQAPGLVPGGANPLDPNAAFRSDFHRRARMQKF